MNLSTHPTFWTAADAPPPDADALSHDLQCDVAIIGSGVTGAFAAYHLAATSLRVVMLDRRPLCAGSTIASTGLLQYELDSSLCDLIARFGREDAFDIYQRAERALHDLAEIVTRHGMACGLHRRRSLYLAHAGDETKSFYEEAAARKDAGIDAEYLSQRSLRERFGIDRPCAILSPFALEVDPYRLTEHLLRHAMSQGLMAFGRTEVTTYQSNSDHVLLGTAGGPVVRARHVIFATGYETPEFMKLPVKLKSTFAFVSKPHAQGAAVLADALLWESARPYLYARQAPEGRFLIGGEDIDETDPTRRNALLPEKTARLVAQFRELFPQSDPDVELAWAGTFAETADGLPLIGPSPRFPRGLFALGYGGNGITFSLIAAQILRDSILGVENDGLRLFRLDRDIPV